MRKKASDSSISTLSSLPVNDDGNYDDSALADLILRSSDSVDFYVLGAFLRYVSPTFNTMFSLSHGQAFEHNEKKDGYHIIPLSDDSETLQLLLDSIYPRAKEPHLGDVGVLWKVCKAAQKYCMDIVEDKLRNRILGSALIERHPLSVYAVAIDLGWEDVATVAARRTLSTRLEDLAYVDELRGITGAGFYRLLEYRFRCNQLDPGPICGYQLTKLPAPTSERYFSADLLPADSDAPIDAEEPFSFHPSATADLVLRSADSVDFFVLGSIIRLVSPTLDDMFPLQPGEHEVREGKPIIWVAANDQVLHHLLGVIYHDVDELDIEECPHFTRIVLTAREYKMTAIEMKLRKQVANSPLVVTDPLRIYAVASALGWDDLAKKAALNTLHQPLEDMPYFQELHLISGADLYRLMRFRFRCADAACDALRNNPFFKKYGIGKWGAYLVRVADNTGTPPSTSGGGEPSTSDLSETAYHKLRSCPRGSTITDAYSLEVTEKSVKSAGGKYKMGVAAFFSFLRCVQDAAKIVEDAVARIDLALK